MTFFLVDCAAIFVSLALVLVVMRYRPRSLTSGLVALLFLSNAAYVIYMRVMLAGWFETAYRFVVPEPLLMLVQLTMNATPGVLMFVCLRMFTERRALAPVLIALFLVQIALEDLLPSLLGISTRPNQTMTMTDQDPRLFALFEGLPAFLQVMFLSFAAYWTCKDWRADVVELSRRLRIVIMGVVSLGMLLYGIATRLIVPVDSVLLLYVHEAWVLMGLIIGAGLLIGLSDPSDLQLTRLLVSARERAPTPSTTAQADLDAFNLGMASGLWQRPGLTINALAQQLGIPQYRLRRLIHEQLGYRNFNAMLNAYRLEAAANALRDPAQRNTPILTIALTVGYQSINPFNRAFRDSYGLAPSEFRQRCED